MQTRLDRIPNEFFDHLYGEGKWAGKPRNVLDTPGLGGTLDSYGFAQQAADQSRVGNPMVAFSGGQASPNPFLAQLQSQEKMKMYDAKAQGMNAALGDLRSQAQGLAQFSIGNEMTRKQAASNALSGFNKSFYDRKPAPNPWMTALKIGMGGVRGLTGAG